MKKLITIDQLEVGMFLDANVVSEGSNGEEHKFLEASNAATVVPTNKRARLTGRMYEKIEQEGGLYLATEKHVQSLKTTGLSMITIDTDKGRDLPDHVQPLTDPDRKPPPEGRLVHFDEEIEPGQGGPRPGH